MRAFISIKYHEGDEGQDLIYHISAALEREEVETVCIPRDFERGMQVKCSPKELMRRAFDEIESSDFIVLDLSEKGVGIGIEAGYAYARGKPIITVARCGSEISTTLRGISEEILFYATFEDLEKLLVSFCERSSLMFHLGVTSRPAQLSKSGG